MSDATVLKNARLITEETVLKKARPVNGRPIFAADCRPGKRDACGTMEAMVFVYCYTFLDVLLTTLIKQCANDAAIEKQVGETIQSIQRLYSANFDPSLVWQGLQDVMNSSIAQKERIFDNWRLFAKTDCELRTLLLPLLAARQVVGRDELVVRVVILATVLFLLLVFQRLDLAVDEVV
jgi:hypothetical protein